MDVDHGLTVPLSLMFGQPAPAWPCKVIPLAVNVVQYPPPDRQPLLQPWQGHPQGRRVVSGGPQGDGLGHRAACRTTLQVRAPVSSIASSTRRSSIGSRATLEGLAQIPHVDYVREAGSEGIELVMWLIMRGALARDAREVYRFLPRPGVEHRRRAHDPRESLIGPPMDTLNILPCRCRCVRVKHLEALAKIDGVRVTSLAGRLREPT